MYKLAKYAMTEEHSKGRFFVEEKKDSRGDFEKDRDRIIHSEAFRKLEYKTQVFVNHEGDYYRTRLTHTMEVSQIARAIAKRLGLNIELVEAIALAHDLGHTPFGHTGEFVLNKLLKNNGGFEHNRHSYRVVTYIERRYPNFLGLNLTFETLEGIVKHSTKFDIPSNADLDEIFNLQVVPILEAQIIDFADEIAYLNHDLDDGLESGLLSWEALEDVKLWAESLKKNKKKCSDKKILKYRNISNIISLLIDDIIDTTKANIEIYGIDSPEKVREVNKKLVGFSNGMKKSRDELRKFLFEKLYRHPKVEKMKITAERCIETLFKTYIDYSEVLPQFFKEEIKDIGIERAVADYIAGMTDRFALSEYRRFNGCV